MRIVGGKYRNRRIVPPKGIEARPTTDYAKEGLFNILHHSAALEGIRVLDLFAGTGSISLEFLSRGAEHVTAVKLDAKLFAHLKRTCEALEETSWHLVKSDVFAFLRSHRGTYDIVFADPPFYMEGTARLPTLVQEAGLLGPDGLLIVEHPKDTDMSAHPWFTKQRTYGAVHFSFFTPPTPSPDPAGTK